MGLRLRSSVQNLWSNIELNLFHELILVIFSTTVCVLPIIIVVKFWGLSNASKTGSSTTSIEDAGKFPKATGGGTPDSSGRLLTALFTNGRSASLNISGVKLSERSGKCELSVQHERESFAVLTTLSVS